MKTRIAAMVLLIAITLIADRVAASPSVEETMMREEVNYVEQGISVPDYLFHMLDFHQSSIEALAFDTRDIDYVIVMAPYGSRNPDAVPYLAAHELAHVIAYGHLNDHTEITADTIVACFGTDKAREFARWNRVNPSDSTCQTLRQGLKRKF